MGIRIQNISYACFHSPFVHNRVLCLKQLLRVPKTTKELMYVSNFSKDNSVFFEYRPHVCFLRILPVVQSR